MVRPDSLHSASGGLEDGIPPPVVPPSGQACESADIKKGAGGSRLPKATTPPAVPLLPSRQLRQAASAWRQSAIGAQLPPCAHRAWLVWSHIFFTHARIR